MPRQVMEETAEIHAALPFQNTEWYSQETFPMNLIDGEPPNSSHRNDEKKTQPIRYFLDFLIFFLKTEYTQRQNKRMI